MEIIVVHGRAGAGKSTHCRSLSEKGFGDKNFVQHISAGEKLRAIRSDEMKSQYEDIIRSSLDEPIPNAIVNSLIFESIKVTESNHGIVLIDDFPRHKEAVEGFCEKIFNSGHQLLGTIAMSIPLDISINRVENRGIRKGERIVGDNLSDFATHRYALDYETTSFAIDALSRLAPVENIDASGTLEETYNLFVHSVGRLVLSSANFL